MVRENVRRLVNRTSHTLQSHSIRDATDGSKGREQVRKHAPSLKMMTFRTTLSPNSLLERVQRLRQFVV
jgi:hypothetical protein